MQKISEYQKQPDILTRLKFFNEIHDVGHGMRLSSIAFVDQLFKSDTQISARHAILVHIYWFLQLHFNVCTWQIIFSVWKQRQSFEVDLILQHQESDSTLFGIQPQQLKLNLKKDGV